MTDQSTQLAENSGIDLLSIFDILWRRKRLIVGGTLIVVLAAWLVGVSLPKVYQVTIKMKSVSTLKSIVVFFRNSSLADSAVRKFNLNESPFDLTTEKFLDENVHVQLNKKTDLIELKVELTDPALAWEVANYTAREGIKRYAEFLQKDFIRKKEYFSSQLDKNRIQLKKEREALIAFQQKVNLTSLTDRRDFLQAQRDKLDSMIVQADIELTAHEAEFFALEDAIKEHKQRLKSNARGSSSLFSDGLNDVVENTEARLIQNRAKYVSLKASKEKMEKIKRETETELALLEEKLASLNVAKEKLYRNLESANQMYKLSKADVTTNRMPVELQAPQITIMSARGIPEKPVRPRVFFISALSGAGAFLFFVFLAFLLEEVARRQPQALKSS